MLKFSYLKGSNAAYIDELFSRYQEDPESIEPSWRAFFEGIEFGQDSVPNGHAHANGHDTALDLNTEAKVAELINAYRSKGRLIANIDPLNPPPASHPLLDLSNFGLTESDLDRPFTAARLLGMERSSLSEIIARLKEIYCSSIGVEHRHINNPTELEWLQTRMETTRNHPNLSVDAKKQILQRLTESEIFENFLHTRYVAQKRFSIEGGEALIPTLDCVIETAAELGANNIVMGMAHRGRLNVLHNIYRKKTEYILTEFEQAYSTDETMGEGDVKYHMGYSADIITEKGKAVHLSLAHNPSHLEFVNPVAEGVARGKQRQLKDKERRQVIPILIHGDAAFAGQGVVYETLNLSQVQGYWTGGTIHIVINNQVGFTTLPEEGRSTLYSTDVAKMLEVPIFHVNGDDPEALIYVAKLCTEYRQKFRKDVVIDLICYRKYGHNEGDEPAFTQPRMYEKIKTHPTPRKIYADRLIAEGVLTEEEAKKLIDLQIQKMTEAQEKTRQEKPKPFISAYQSIWKKFRQAAEHELFTPVATGVEAKVLQDLGRKIYTFPEGFHLHPKLARIFEGRAKSIEEGTGIDWGTGEALAYASLLREGHNVRLSGQDCERGTFSHRMSVLHDTQSGEKYTPLNHVANTDAEYIVHNSTLSETAVLGFEYGWSLADPNSLVIWEAQFGDFANGAQVIIDQFIASGESKWRRASGIVLFLPHGYEGQGPEHSSARLERFLQLAGKQNMIICNFTTPANLFHALRRQLKWEFRKPMVVMTPKSLLRHPLAVSNLEEFTQGSFVEVIDDPVTRDHAGSVKRVILCSGKVYYDLLAEREQRGIKDIALLRVEQLYPWPAHWLEKLLKKYESAKDIVWAQEEPRNMGAWSFVFNTWSGGYDDFQTRVGNRPIRYVGRERGAAPAVGSAKRHASDHKDLIEKALGA